MTLFFWHEFDFLLFKGKDLMASTITAATATVTITESITLNGVDQGGSNTLSISNVNESDRRIVTAPLSGEIDLIELDTNNGQGKFVRANIRYIRITNLDDTNFIRVRVKKSSAETFDVKVLAGSSFMLSSGSIDANTSGAAFSAFVDLDNISVQADTASCDIEFCVLSV
tara:strand:+ start:972 stop:1481 length:510 start_codon:yes stop_codon:yes gene_type:complete